VKRKFNHEADFGVMGRYNQTRATQFEQALRSHVEDPTTIVIQGTYCGASVTHFVNPQMGLNVIRDADGAFVSAWRLTRNQLANVLSRGSL
jgi:hypothetical protein